MTLDTSVDETVTRVRGGWWHEYVCPVHHTELLTPIRSYGSLSYPCPHGCQLRDEPYASAWLVLEHQHTARRLRCLARRAAAGEPATCAEQALRLVEEYADFYGEVSGEGWNDDAKPWMLRGKLFHQALTEAIWATNLANAVWTLSTAELVDLDRLAAAATPLLTGLRGTVRDARRVLVRERDELNSNYTAWLNAADALIGGALERLGTGSAEPEAWLESDEGLYAHVRAAVLPDGWEWEAATYYHGFVLRAYLYALRGRSPAHVPDDVAATIIRMLRVLEMLATADGALPSLHDSPYHRPAGDESLLAEHRRAEARELLELATLGAQFAALPSLRRIGRHAARLLAADDAPFEGELAGWFGGSPLLCSPQQPGSHLFGDAGYAVLRPPGGGTWQAVVDFGPHGGSHGHLDKLALYLYGDGVAWQPDPGVVPYGSRLRHGHYRTTVAHPTVLIDGEDQSECDGTLERWDVDHTRTVLVASTDAAYSGVVLRRQVTVDRRHIVDVFDVEADDVRSIVLQFRPDVDVDVVADGFGWTTRWGGATPLTATHRSAETALEVRPGYGPADDPQRTRPYIDWRAETTRARFVTVFTPGGETPDVDVTADAVHIRLGAAHTTVPIHEPGRPST